ncbi:MAG: DUF58 domain-containing protein, partial [Armatimonadota bacterium]|nr:DUF58 domain-containing protein [Armatimonadota bacterium]
MMSPREVLPLFLLLILTGIVLVFVLRARNPKLTTVTLGPLFLFLVAGILGAGQLYTMGTMLLSAWVVTWILSRISLRGLEVTRTATTPVTRGEDVEIRVEVTNRHRLPKLFLRVRCPLPKGLQASRDTFVIAGLWPGQRAIARLKARAARRGCYQLAPLQLLGADPLDIFQRTDRRDAPVEIVVYPTADTVPGFDLWGDDLFGELPARRVSRPTAGLDFHSLRDYQPGDDIRTIDWKATARLSRLVVVTYEP